MLISGFSTDVRTVARAELREVPESTGHSHQFILAPFINRLKLGA
ncbi:hypothetical protein OAT89_01125 [bacterium]|nr:hypothetical protein [bacterium]